MTAGKKIKMRLLRLYVHLKRNLSNLMITLLIMGIFAAGVYQVFIWGKYYVGYAFHDYILDDLYDSYNYRKDLSNELCFYDNGSHSYVRDKATKKKVLKDIQWVAGSEFDDSLLCFAKDGYRGYFDRHSGKIVIPADRYKKAWLFSEELAAVMDADSTVKFINTSGEVVINQVFRFSSQTEGKDFLFRNGYCAMPGPSRCWGILDHTGHWVVAPQYDNIKSANLYCWIVERKGKKGLLNDKLQPVLDPEYREVYVNDYGIEVLCDDYTRKLLTLDGKVVNSFTCTKVWDLPYKVDCDDEDAEDCTWDLSPYKAYQTTYSQEDSVKVGLLGPDGVPVTQPLYHHIKAVNANVFRCFYTDPYSDTSLSVLINTKGQVINP